MEKEYEDPVVSEIISSNDLVFSLSPKQAFQDELLRDDTVILMPVTKGRAPLISEYTGLRKYTDDLFTVYANITGLPAVSFAAGVREDGSPVGIQLMGSRGSEGLLLDIATKAGGYDHV